MTFIAITHADDTISISEVLAEDVASVVQKIEAAYQNDIDQNGAGSAFVGKLPFKGWRIIDKADIPADRSYRNAWRDRGDGVEHDMTHAREMHKDKLRRERGPKLDALDVEYQRADEQGNNQLKQQIAQQKQALRDITKDPRIAAAQTIDELKQIVI